MIQDGLLDRCEALIAAGDQDPLLAAIPDLEAIHPADPASWRRAHAIFGHLQRPVWQEIMTRRFLHVAPLNVDARLQAASAVSEAPTRRDEAIEMAQALDDLAIEAAGDCLRVGSIFSNCAMAGPAAEWFGKAAERDPADVGIRINIIYAYIGQNEFARAKVELAKLRDLADGRADVLTAVVTLAMRMNQSDIADAAIVAALASVAPDDAVTRSTLVVQCAQLGRTADARRIAGTTDFTAVQQPALLQAVYHAIEGRGEMAAERQVIDAALRLNADDPVFKQRQRRLADPLAERFAQAPSSAPGLRSFKDRVRDLMFWR